MSWNDPTGSGFHSQQEKDNNRKLRDQVDSLAKNYSGGAGNAWRNGGNYASGRSSGKYEHKLMNDNHLQHIISYLRGRQKQAPAPPKATPPPVVDSPEIKQAVGHADAYKSDLIGGNPTEEIYNVDSTANGETTQAEDYSKETYINRNSKSNTQFDFSAKTFMNDKKDKQEASQDFFNKKKDQVTTSSKYKEFMQ